MLPALKLLELSTHYRGGGCEMKEDASAQENRELGAVNVPMTGQPEGQKEPGLHSETATSEPGNEQRQQQIAEAAYRRAERRGFSPGQELDDWLAAEREVDGETPEER